MARFLEVDTYTGELNDPLSLNLYTYCHNEPLMYSDPSGHFTEGLILSKDTDSTKYKNDILELQRDLTSAGWYKTELTGKFDGNTEDAVNKYKDHVIPHGNEVGSKNRGKVGATTWLYLKRDAGLAKIKGLGIGTTDYNTRANIIWNTFADGYEDLFHKNYFQTASKSVSKTGNAYNNGKNSFMNMYIDALFKPFNFDNAKYNGKKIVIEDTGHIFIVTGPNKMQALYDMDDKTFLVAFGAMVTTSKSANEGFTRTNITALGRLHNTIKDHLLPKDFSGTEADLMGKPFAKSSGVLWQHETEMNNSYDSLYDVKESLEGSLKNPKLQPFVRKQLEAFLKITDMYMKDIETLYAKYGKEPGIFSIDKKNRKKGNDDHKGNGNNSSGGGSGGNRTNNNVVPIVPEVPISPKMPEIPIMPKIPEMPFIPIFG